METMSQPDHELCHESHSMREEKMVGSIQSSWVRPRLGAKRHGRAAVLRQVEPDYIKFTITRLLPTPRQNHLYEYALHIVTIRYRDIFICVDVYIYISIRQDSAFMGKIARARAIFRIRVERWNKR